jgi:flagellar biosynthesis/type III secretory pathway protein FliH
MAEGMAEGRAEGMAKGMAKAHNLTSLLYKYLLAHNLMDEWEKSLDDEEYYEALIEKYNISVSK